MIDRSSDAQCASFEEDGKSAPADGDTPPVVVINADARTPHQSVVDVMQAAQRAGLPHITFATQSSAQ